MHYLKVGFGALMACVRLDHPTSGVIPLALGAEGSMEANWTLGLPAIWVHSPQVKGAVREPLGLQRVPLRLRWR